MGIVETTGNDISSETKYVTVDRQKHRDLGVDPERCREFAANFNTVYINFVEFFSAQKDYPIIFTVNNNQYLPCSY